MLKFARGTAVLGISGLGVIYLRYYAFHLSVLSSALCEHSYLWGRSKVSEFDWRVCSNFSIFWIALIYFIFSFFLFSFYLGGVMTIGGLTSGSIKRRQSSGNTDHQELGSSAGGL